MSMTRLIPVDSATVVERDGKGFIQIPDDGQGIVAEWRCDVAKACDGGPRQRIEHDVQMIVDGPGYPPTKVHFSACAACCRLVVPNPVRLVLASFGIDVPPGLMPDA